MHTSVMLQSATAININKRCLFSRKCSSHLSPTKPDTKCTSDRQVFFTDISSTASVFEIYVWPWQTKGFVKTAQYRSELGTALTYSNISRRSILSSKEENPKEKQYEHYSRQSEFYAHLCAMTLLVCFSYYLINKTTFPRLL